MEATGWLAAFTISIYCAFPEIELYGQSAGVHQDGMQVCFHNFQNKKCFFTNPKVARMFSLKLSHLILSFSSRRPASTPVELNI